MDCSGAEVVAGVRRAVVASLERTGLLRGRRALIVAVSGGADSTCLLDAVMAVAPGAARRVTVAHVDHRLRPDSALDAAHVQGVAGRYGVPCEAVAIDVPALARRERRGIEDAARVARYRALLDVAAARRADAMLTGHTADDSVETVILHLLRGSGLSGLGGIAEVETLTPRALGQSDVQEADPSVRLVRPLLQVSRAETVAYCLARSIAWRDDPSNADQRLLRNRVRGHLLPVLRTYNPSVDRALARMAQAVRADDAWLERAARERMRRVVVAEGDSWRVELERWRRQPVALQRRLVRLIAAAAGLTDPGFEAVERALAVAGGGGPPRAELGRGLSVARQQNTIRFERSAQVHERGEDE